MSSSLQDALDLLRRKQPLTRQLAQTSISLLMTGDVSEEEIRAFLTGLREKGETIEEVMGCAQAMREHAVPFPVPAKDLAHAVDTCGAGGDRQGTINVSTMGSFILAAAGVPVVKHGNRSVSSQCGSADVLEALKIDGSVPPERMLECFKRTNWSFLFAPLYHPAMKHVAPVRKALGVRTIFNLVGPLTNPAGVKRQVVGAPEKPLASLMAEAFQRLGVEHVAVVFGEDGMDEVTTTATTFVAEVRHGDAKVLHTEFDAEQALGLRRVRVEQLRGGDAATNARLARQLLASGADEALRPMQELVLVNAAWGLYVSGMYSESIAQCFDVARMSLESGSALKKLQEVQQCLPRAT